jgi:hypothetical protein
MTKQQILSELEKPGPVFVYVAWSKDDALYVEAKKIDVKYHMSNIDENSEIEARRESDGLYIG